MIQQKWQPTPPAAIVLWASRTSVVNASCSTGLARTALLSKNCRVLGVDAYPEALKTTGTICDSAVRVDVNCLAWTGSLPRQFDVTLMSKHSP